MKMSRRLLAGIVAFLVVDANAATSRSVAIHSPSPHVGDFELMDHNGKPFRLDAVGAGGALIFFGFTHCPGTCPLALQKLRRVERDFAEAGETPPRTILISVDGDRDTPSALKAYLEPMSKEFIGLTGPPQSVRRLAEKFSAVFFKGLPGDDSGTYVVDHTSQIYLVDGAGRLRATFFDASVGEIAVAVRSLLAE